MKVIHLFYSSHIYKEELVFHNLVLVHVVLVLGHAPSVDADASFVL